MDLDPAKFQIYFGTVNSQFYALDQDGNLRWKNTFGPGGSVYASPAVGRDGTVYAATFGVSTLYAFEPVTGRTNWVFNPPVSGLPAFLYSSPTIAVDGTVYIGSHDRNLYALNPKNGAIKWKFPTDRRIDSSPAIALDGTIYVATGNLDFPQGTIYAINPDGSKRWEYRIRAGIQSSPAIDQDGTVVFGGFDGRLYALTQNGTLKWSFDAGGGIFSSPGIGGDGTYYFSADDASSSFFGLTPTGALRWKASPALDFIHSSPVIQGAGVYFGSLDNSIYKLEIETGLRQPQWGMFRGNVRHTGRSPFILRIISPENGRTFKAPSVVRLEAEAYSSQGTVSLAFYQRREGEPFATQINSETLNTPPFVTSWNVAIPGQYTLYARVIDGDFIRAESPEINVLVSDRNSPPSIGEISPQTAAMGSSLTVPFTVNDDITPRELLKGTLTAVDGNIMPAGSGQVAMTSTNGFLFLNLTPTGVGQTTVTLTVSDEDGGSSSASFELTVRKINFAPEIAGAGQLTTREDTPVSFNQILVNDLDHDVNLLILEAASSDPTLIPSENIKFTGSGNFRTVTILPATNRTGVAVLSVLVTDPEGASAQVEFPVMVTPVADLPIISRIPDITLTNSQPRTVAFTIFDAETPSTNLFVTALSSDTAVVPAANVELGGSGADRTITILAPVGASGSSRITVTVDDRQFGRTETNFLVTILQPNRPPIASNLSTNVIEDQAREIRLHASDLDNNPLTYRIVTAPAQGSLFNFSGSATVVYVPNTNATGADSFTFKVSDGTAESSVATVSIVIAGVNDPPILFSIQQLEMDEDTVQTIPFTVADAESPLAALLVTVQSSNSLLIPNGDATLKIGGVPTSADRTLTIKPLPNQFGDATLFLVLNDGAATVTNAILLRVRPIADRPTISAFNPISLDEDTASPELPFTIGDSDTPISSLTLQAVSSNAALIPSTNIRLSGNGDNRFLSFTPAANQSGSVSITLTVSDGAASATSILSVTVNEVPDPPSIAPLPDVTIAENTETGFIFITLSDPDIPAPKLQLTGTSSNTKVVLNTGLSFGGAGFERTLVITPILNQWGETTITLVVSDGQQSSLPRTLRLLVTNQNGPPAISNIPDQTMDEDQAGFTVAFTVSDQDTPVANLTILATSANFALNPLNSLIVAGTGTDRTLRIAPTRDQFGANVITVTVSDGVLTASDSFRLTVRPVADAPFFATPLTNMAAPRTALELQQPFIVADPDEGDVANLTFAVASSNPSVIPSTAANLFVRGGGANRVLHLVPGPSAIAGQSLITVAVRDASGAAATNRFELTLTAVAQPPTITAIPDLSLNEDTPSSTIQFTVNDAETPASALVMTISSSDPSVIPPNSANVLIQVAGTVRFMTVIPAPEASGAATLRLTVMDSDGMTNSISFKVTVAPVNDPPVIDPLNGLAIDEDTQPFAITFVLRDPDTPLDQVRVLASSSNTQLLPEGSLSVLNFATAPTLLITVPPGRSGEATVSLIADDQAGGRSTNSFPLFVIGVSDPPEMGGLPASISVVEDSRSTPFQFTIGDSETVAGELLLSFSSSNPPLFPPGSVIFGGAVSNRTVMFAPAANQFGSATVSIIVKDLDGLINSAAIEVVVEAVNDAPLAVADAFVGDEDVPLSIPLIEMLKNDIDVDDPNLTVISLSDPRNGTALLSADRVVFTPSTNFSGTASFSYAITDGSSSSSASVILDVRSINDAPKISDIPDQTVAEGGSVLDIPFLIEDAETPAELLNITFESSQPLLIADTGIRLGGNGSGGGRTLSLTPVPGRSGTAVLRVTVSDGTTAASDSFQLVVTDVEDAPSISAIADRDINEDTSTGVITFTVQDAETPATSLVVTAVSSNPALTPSSRIQLGGTGMERTLVITPASNATGLALITLRVTDGGNLSASESFVLTVRDAPDAPTISPIADFTTPEDTATTPVAFTVADAETAAGNLVVIALSSNPALVASTNMSLTGASADRALVITPRSNQSGAATLLLVVIDESGLTNTSRFNLTVAPVNDPPTIVPVNSLRIDEGTPPFSLLFAIGDIDSPIDRLIVSPASSNPALLPAANLRVTGTNVTRSLRIQPVPGITGQAIVSLVVDDRAGGLATNTFNLEVRPALPVFISLPVGAAVYQNDSVAFSATASGTPPLLYQWSRNGATIPNATNSNLTLTSAQFPNSGAYSVRVSNAVGAINSPPVTLAVSPLPTLRAAAAAVTEGNAGSVALEFSLTLSAPIPRNVVFRFATANGTARAGEDYSSASGLIVIPPDSLSTRVIVSVLGDSTFEPDETLFVELTAATNAVLAETRIVGSIVNDDAEPQTGPVVSITSPLNAAAFTVPAQVPIQATARAPGSSVARVDFFAGTTPVGSDSIDPFAIVWTNTAVGTYTLTAIAVDQAGERGTSAPVRILVSRSVSSAPVAIVRNAPHADIERIQDLLLELGLTSQVFDRDGLTPSDLDGFQLVMWHDAAQPGLLASDVSLFQQLSLGPAALYFIGERLASSAVSLPSTQRSQWQNLTRLVGGDSRSGPAPAIAVDPGSLHPAINGRFGVVGPFGAPSPVDRAAVVFAAATSVLATAEQGTIAVVTAVDRESGLGRLMAQNTLVTTGTDALSASERKKLVKNAVVWLLRKSFNAFTDLSLALTSSAATVNAGDPFTLTWTLRQRGEVEASGVALAISIPPQAVLVSAEFTQGDFQPAIGGAVFSPGNMESAAPVILRLNLRGVASGIGSLGGSISGNEPDPNPANNAANASIEVKGNLAQPIRLEVARFESGELTGIIHADLGRTLVVEFSSDLRTWTPLVNLRTTSASTSFTDRPPQSALQRYYRVRVL